MVNILMEIKGKMEKNWQNEKNGKWKKAEIEEKLRRIKKLLSINKLIP